MYVVKGIMLLLYDILFNVCLLSLNLVKKGTQSIKKFINQITVHYDNCNITIYNLAETHFSYHDR